MPIIGPVLSMFVGGFSTVIWLLGLVWTTCKWLILAVLIAVLICCVLFGVKVLHWLASTVSWLWKSISGKSNGT